MPRDMTELRIWQQGQLLRLLAGEWEQRRPVAEGLRAYTDLAEAILAQGLEIAREGRAEAPRLAVLGLGRLGLGELDLLSDVDVVFVARESEREAATRLAAGWIQVLTAYTQAGTLYAVDTRLRPGGGEGELVQTPASLERYFRDHAGWWEGVSYLKARLVAGDREVGEQAIEALQAGLRQRFGGRQGGGELQNLRNRMEREGKPGKWGLKTVAGGYYDVDFAISQRLLEAGAPGFGAIGLAGWAQAAGQGLVSSSAAATLAQQVSLLRAADHALRVGTGKAGSSVPAAGVAVDNGWQWLERLQPAVPADQAPELVEEAKVRIRAIYQELL
jgi:glutamate-ammonia-ligase adenylyltransferase